ncbi:FimD/PapC N-terminal domain-containing protein [Escherichia coli]
MDIYLNDGYMTTRDVTFNAGDKDKGLLPCLTRGQLASMGVSTGSVAGLKELPADSCVPLIEMIEDITIRFRCGSTTPLPYHSSGIYGQSRTR